MEAHNTALALRVSELLRKQGMTEHQLATKAKVPFHVVQKIVKGWSERPSCWTILALAEALGVTTDYLLKPEFDSA